MEIKVGFTIPEKFIDSIMERKRSTKDDINEIIRDEIDKLIDDKDNKFFDETIPQVKAFIEGWEEFNSYYRFTNIPSPKNGRGKRIHHGRHKK